MIKNTLRAVSLAAILAGGMGLSATLPSVGSAQAAALPRCHTGRLLITQDTSSAGMGHAGTVFRIRSLAQGACTLYGYPGAQLVDGNGRDLPTHLRWGQGYLFGNPAPRQMVLQPNGSAVFGLEWVHFPSPGQTCPTASYLLVTPPNERTTIVVPMRGITACGGMLTATPVLPSLTI